MHTKQQDSPANMNSMWVLAVLGLLMGFASISTDVYLPAMPAMANTLSANDGMIEWTVSGYLIGFSIGQLFWGPISDRYGRRLPVAIGLILFIIGSAGCAFSPSIWLMICARIVQAIGACASVVISRAMVRDLYSGSRAAQMMSTLITIMAIAPLIGPFIGGQILIFAGWRWIFGFLVMIGITTLIALYTIPETLSANNRSIAPLKTSLLRYLGLLKYRSIIAYMGVGGFFYGGVYAYVAGGPFAFITHHGLAPESYGFVFGTAVISVMVCNIINTKIVHKYGSTKVIMLGGIITLLTGLLLALAGKTDIGGIIGLIIPIAIYMGMNGFLVANSMAGAMEDFPNQAGAVSALLGATQYGSGIIGSGLVGYFADGTAWPMAAVVGSASLLTFICTLFIPKNVEIKEQKITTVDL